MKRGGSRTQLMKQGDAQSPQRVGKLFVQIITSPPEEYASYITKERAAADFALRVSLSGKSRPNFVRVFNVVLRRLV